MEIVGFIILLIGLINLCIGMPLKQLCPPVFGVTNWFKAFIGIVLIIIGALILGL